MDLTKKTILDHISEFRKRVIYILILFLITFTLGFFISLYVIEFIKNTPPANSMSLNVFSPWDSIKIYTGFSMLIGLVLTVPFLFYQIWLFLKPGLKDNEKRAILLYIPFAPLCFLVGILFSYFVVTQLIFNFANSLTIKMGLTETFGITNYFMFVLSLVLPISLIFELPVIVSFLTKIGIITPNTLSKHRRYAYLTLTIIGTLVTPPDFFSAVVVSVPLILLYEASVQISGFIYRKNNKLNF